MKATKFLISTAAAVTVAGAIGLAYAQTSTYNAPGATGSQQSQTTTTGQTPANVPGSTQSQQQNAASGSMTTNSSGTNTGSTNAGVAPGTTGNANNNPPTGAAPASPRTENTRLSQAPAGSNMNDGTTARTNDGNSNVRANSPSTSGGMATERDARPDRN